MKSARNYLLIVSLIWFSLSGVIMLISEPVSGSYLDSVLGIFLLKVAAFFHIFIAVCSYRAMTSSFKKKLQEWFHDHFSHE